MGEARGREDETRWVQREPERLRTRRAEKTDRERGRREWTARQRRSEEAAPGCGQSASGPVC